MAAGGRDRGKNGRQSSAGDAGSHGAGPWLGAPEDEHLSEEEARRGQSCVSSVQLCTGGSAVSCQPEHSRGKPEKAVS